MQTLQTNFGPMTIDSVLDHLAYTSYATNRDAGVKHETLVKWGIGNDGFNEKYLNATGQRQPVINMTTDPKEPAEEVKQPEGEQATETQAEVLPDKEEGTEG